MDLLLRNFDNLNIHAQALFEDVSYLIMCHEKNVVDIEQRIFKVPITLRKYNDVLRILKEHFSSIYVYEMLELMPLIDMYLNVL